MPAVHMTVAAEGTAVPWGLGVPLAHDLAGKEEERLGEMGHRARKFSERRPVLPNNPGQAGAGAPCGVREVLPQMHKNQRFCFQVWLVPGTQTMSVKTWVFPACCPVSALPLPLLASPTLPAWEWRNPQRLPAPPPPQQLSKPHQKLFDNGNKNLKEGCHWSIPD